MTSWPEWPVARLADLADSAARGFLVGDGDWPFRGLVVRRHGELFAYANICPHQRHPLDFPPDRFLTPDRELLRCASHGALFEPHTGRCVLGPCVGKGLLKLECRVADGRIWVRAPGSLLDLETPRSGGEGAQ